MIPCELPPEEPLRPDLPAILEGGCHCGAVHFRVTIRAFDAATCNCSMCTMKGFIHVIVAKEDFDLVRGQDALTTYTFNTRTAKHLFCSKCGVSSFYVPRSHPDGFSVNLRCITDADPSWFELASFDGQRWEANIDAFR